MEYGNDFDFSYGVPDGPTMSSSGSDIFSVIVTVYLLVIVAAVIIGIVKYVFKSMALYRLAQRTGNANPWMAWVPFARSYLQGELAGSMPLKKRRLQSPGLWKVLIPLIGTAVIAGLYFLFIVVAGIGTILNYSVGMGAGGLTLSWGIVFLLIIAAVALPAIEAVLDVLVNFHIYHRLTSHNMAIIHSVLGLFIPMYEAICLFIMSKKPYNPGMEPNLPPQAPNFGGNPIPPTMPVSPAASETPAESVSPAASETPAASVSPAASETPAESVSPMPAEAPVQQVPVTPTESSAQNPYVNPMQVQGTESLAKDAQSTEAEPTENSAEK